MQGMPDTRMIVSTKFQTSMLFGGCQARLTDFGGELKKICRNLMVIWGSFWGRVLECFPPLITY